MVDTVFSDSVEPECYPDTIIFVNLLNISSSKELRDKEAGFTATRSIELFQNTELTPQTFDFNHLKSIHHHLDTGLSLPNILIVPAGVTRYLLVSICS